MNSSVYVGAVPGAGGTHAPESGGALESAPQAVSRTRIARDRHMPGPTNAPPAGSRERSGAMFVIGDMTALLIRLIAPLAVVAAGCSNSGEPRRAYVGLFGDNAVAVIDTTSSKVLATIDVAAPDGLVITPDGAKLYVSSNTGGVIDVIDTATEHVTTSIAVGLQPAGLAISRDGRHVVAAIQGDGKVVVIDTSSDTVTSTLAVAKPHNAALSADGVSAYIASQVTTAPAVDVVGVPGAAAGATFTLDKSPRALCAAGGKLYVTVAGSAAIEVLDATTGQLGTPITTGGSPHDIRPTLDGARVLAVSQTAGDLEIIDPASSTVTATVATGTMPHWIGLASDGKLAYVTNEGDGTVSVIDLANPGVVKTFAVGTGPRKIAIQP
jgi:YVTN family beta-propeller protein